MGSHGSDTRLPGLLTHNTLLRARCPGMAACLATRSTARTGRSPGRSSLRRQRFRKPINIHGIFMHTHKKKTLASPHHLECDSALCSLKQTRRLIKLARCTAMRSSTCSLQSIQRRAPSTSSVYNFDKQLRVAAKNERLQYSSSQEDAHELYSTINSIVLFETEAL